MKIKNMLLKMLLIQLMPALTSPILQTFLFFSVRSQWDPNEIMSEITIGKHLLNLKPSSNH